MLIRLIGVKLSGLIAGSYQADLFNDSIKDISLSSAIDKIRLKCGYDKIMRGISLQNVH